MLFMPFSPRWLLHHGREKEARHVLSYLRNLSEDHELIELEFLEIKAQSTFEKRSIAEKWPHLVELKAWNIFKLQFVAIASLFRTKAMFRRVIVATVTMFFQQFTGINAVLYYAPSIFTALGTSSNTTSLLATGVVGVAMFLATIPAVLYIDKFGRKPIMLTGAAGMAICHFIIAAIFGTLGKDWASHKAAGWAACTFVWLFVVNFGYSWGPCAWTIISEVWPVSNRAYGIALGASANWMSNFIIGQITPDMLQDLKYGTFIFFGLVGCTGGFLFVWLYVPETKRLTLEEMDDLFGSKGVAQAVSNFYPLPLQWSEWLCMPGEWMNMADEDSRTLLALQKSTRRSDWMISFVASVLTRPSRRPEMGPARMAMRKLVPRRMRSRLPSDLFSSGCVCVALRVGFADRSKI